jgi:tRNA-Thr(GGU) m(6)t(6)A37 methyltransferase TsaA
MKGFAVFPVGTVRARRAPHTGREESDILTSTLEIFPEWSEAAEDIKEGDRILVLFRFHLSEAVPCKVHPKGDRCRPLKGVFSTRSPKRPNFIGCTACLVTKRTGLSFEVEGLDALDGSPILDIKPCLEESW